MTEVRLIDANALKAKLKIGTNSATYSDYCNGYCDARQVDLDAIDAAPTIEAEPVRHGRWDEIVCFSEHGIPMAQYECTNCGNDIERQRGVVPPYCEFCGAQMDGGADD